MEATCIGEFTKERTECRVDWTENRVEDILL